MSMTDPIADMLTRIRNAQNIKKVSVTMPHSKIKEQIASVLQSEGYIVSFESAERDNNKKDLIITLKYYMGNPVIETLQRTSKPSLREYQKSANLPNVLDGLGVAIISTSKGVMSDKQAREQGIGGEIICMVT